VRILVATDAAGEGVNLQRAHLMVTYDLLWNPNRDMNRAEAGRPQPHFIASFFRDAFTLLGGSIRERELGRYEITDMPAPTCSRDRQIGTGEPILARYERIAFEKERIAVPGKPLAAFVCPGHPLLDAMIDLILECYRDFLKRGAVLVDPDDVSAQLLSAVFCSDFCSESAVAPWRPRATRRGRPPRSPAPCARAPPWSRGSACPQPPPRP
jgi:Helicase conserved C-terminal domain